MPAILIALLLFVASTALAGTPVVIDTQAMLFSVAQGDRRDDNNSLQGAYFTAGTVNCHDGTADASTDFACSNSGTTSFAPASNVTAWSATGLVADAADPLFCRRNGTPDRAPCSDDAATCLETLGGGGTDTGKRSPLVVYDSAKNLYYPTAAFTYTGCASAGVNILGFTGVPVQIDSATDTIHEMFRDNVHYSQSGARLVAQTIALARQEFTYRPPNNAVSNRHGENDPTGLIAGGNYGSDGTLSIGALSLTSALTSSALYGTGVKRNAGGSNGGYVEINTIATTTGAHYVARFWAKHYSSAAPGIITIKAQTSGSVDLAAQTAWYFDGAEYPQLASGAAPNAMAGAVWRPYVVSFTAEGTSTRVKVLGSATATEILAVDSFEMWQTTSYTTSLSYTFASASQAWWLVGDSQFATTGGYVPEGLDWAFGAHRTDVTLPGTFVSRSNATGSQLAETLAYNGLAGGWIDVSDNAGITYMMTNVGFIDLAPALFKATSRGVFDALSRMARVARLAGKTPVFLTLPQYMGDSASTSCSGTVNCGAAANEINRLLLSVQEQSALVGGGGAGPRGF